MATQGKQKKHRVRVMREDDPGKVAFTGVFLNMDDRVHYEIQTGNGKIVRVPSTLVEFVGGGK